uniref:Uncharacterized protein n=1 Tax=Rhizophora mucronata TaxID=61149 RepID=A0A2P2JAS9_RHIMU
MLHNASDAKGSSLKNILHYAKKMFHRKFSAIRSMSGLNLSHRCIVIR